MREPTEVALEADMDTAAAVVAALLAAVAMLWQLVLMGLLAILLLLISSRSHNYRRIIRAAQMRHRQIQIPRY